MGLWTGGGRTLRRRTRPEMAVNDPYADPLDDAPPVTPRGSLVLTVIAWVLAVAALLPTGLSFLLGPVGMACGLVAHLKGRRAGFVAACAAALATVLGLSLQAFLTPF